MELTLILALVLILFGAGRLPDVFSQLGKAVKNFKDAQKDDTIDVGGDQKRLKADDEAIEAEAEKEKAKEKEKERRAS
jgi:sec-independent protein translocase protein TatA